MSRGVWWLGVTAAIALFATAAGAQERPRIRGLNDDERAALMPLLERGSVAVVESNPDGTLKQVSVAHIIRAPQAAVFALVSQPETYPSFMPNISATRVVERRNNMVAYEWSWRGVLVEMGGANAMTLYAPRRIDIEATRGDLGRGRFRWDFHALPDGRTLAVHSVYSDMRSANYILRQLIESDRSMMHAMNLSTALVLMMGVKTKVEQIAGTGDGRRPSGGVSGSGDLRDVGSLVTPGMLPLLRRGEVALVQMDSRGRMRQSTAFGRVPGATPDAVRGVVANPRDFPRVMPHVESVEIVNEPGGTGTLFDWELAFPVINVTGRMRLTSGERGRVLLEAPEGDLQGGRWMWEVPQVGGETIAVYSSRANLARANWILGRLIGREPFFLHGLSCASNLVAVRAIQQHFAN